MHPVAKLSLALLVVSCTAVESPGSTSKGGDDSGELDTGTAPLPDLDDALTASLQEIADSAASQLEAGGVIVGLSVPGYAPFVAAAGTANASTGETMTPEHTSRIGSVTKTFVSAATLQLVDEGLLSLEDTVSDHLDVIARGDDITVTHLLGHTSGLKDYTYESELTGRFTDTWTDAELIAIIADDALVSEPGSSYSYANTNYVLLGMLIEAVTGERWDEAVEARFIEPLGLVDTRAPGGSEGWGSTVPGYIGSIDVSSSLSPSLFGASGAIESSATDQLIWGAACMSGSLVSDELYALQMAEDVVVSHGMLWGRLGLFQWDSEFDGDDPELWHNGAVNGYAAWLGHRPESGITVSVLANGWIQEGPGSYDYNYPMGVARDVWSVIDTSD
jgi:D-alanyl-D-alanine carboxypeptidase